MWGGLLFLTAVTLFLLGYFLQVELQLTGNELGVPLDDAWIHFQFARNLSQGNGFSYNPGEPMPGSTAPLWTILLAGVGLFRADYLQSALALSAFFLLLSVWLAFGFTYWVSRSYWAAFLAAAGTILAGRMLWAGLAAMETTAFAALSLAAIWAYSKWGFRSFTAVLFALASQFRPEGHALFALAFIDAGWNWWSDHRGMKAGRFLSIAGQFFPALVVYAVISAPYSIFSLAITGQPFPNTFYAKVGSQHFFSLRTLRETAAWHWQDNPISILLLFLGIYPLWRRSRLAILWLLGLPLLTAIIIDFTWHHGRYTMPLIPLQMVTAAVGAHWLINKLTGDKLVFSKSNQQLVSGFLIVVLAGLFLLGGVWNLPYWASMLGNNAREVQDIDVAQGKWLAKNSPADALIAVDDIGAIAFFSERRIIDLNGLVSPEVWPAMRAGEGLARNQILTRILSQAQPGFMSAFPLWRWDIATNPVVAQPLHQVHTDTHTIIFQQDASIYRMTWPYLTEASPEQVIDSTFGDGIRLMGFDISHNSFIELTLYWQSLQPVSDSYDVFVHLLDENGQIVAQLDQKPIGGLAATDVWLPGDIIRDPLQLLLPPDLASGDYELRIGVYLRESGKRLPVSGGKDIDNALILDRLTLP